MSDIHGEYDAFLKMLKKIRFSEADTLYILGDLMDRGKHPIKLLFDVMERPNVICLQGNHDLMALYSLDRLKNNPEKFAPEIKEEICAWQLNGGVTTSDEFNKLNNHDKRRTVIHLGDAMEFYGEIRVGGKDYVLLHAGLRDFSPDKPLSDYRYWEVDIWETPDYERVYYQDKYLVTGHTPTAFIEGNPRSNRIYRKNNHIAIDCGAGMGGRLGCLRLDDDKEFYVECE